MDGVEEAGDRDPSRHRKPARAEQVRWWGWVAATLGFAAIFEVAPWKRLTTEQERRALLLAGASEVAMADREAGVIAAEAWSVHDNPRIRHVAAHVMEWTFDYDDERTVAVAERLEADSDERVRRRIVAALQRAQAHREDGTDVASSPASAEARDERP
jgi:hypothetical protein